MLATIIKVFNNYVNMHKTIDSKNLEIGHQSKVLADWLTLLRIAL